MFKALVRVFILFTLLLGNMALFTWCVNSLDLGGREKNLINSVQAEQSILDTQSRPVSPTPQSMMAHSLPLRSATTPLRVKSHHRLALHFQSGRLQIEPQEQITLEEKLRKLDIGPSHTIIILVGPVFSENNILSPQKAKLRAQSVARIVYPYTPTVKMLYRPQLEEGLVVVEFFQSGPK